MSRKKDEALDRGTEERILATAKEVFLSRGKNGARMEEIARAAGVNKALLHYYYRSKDNIFQAVFRQVGKVMVHSVTQNVDFSKPVKEILSCFVENHLRVIRSNQRLFPFFFSEMWMNRDEVVPLFREIILSEEKPITVKFFERIDTGIKNREIRSVDPFQLMLNIISLNVFYCIASPVFFSLTDITPEKRKQIDESRAGEVVEFVWESIRYRDEKESV